MTAPSARSAPSAGEHWDEVYAGHREDGVSWYQPAPEPSLRLLRAAAPNPASVIDVGGGRSRLAGALAAAGCRDVTVLDVSATALADLAASFAASGGDPAAIELQVADIRTWTPDRRRLLWHDRAVFHFLVDGTDRDAYVRAATEGVEPGGALVMGTFAPDGPRQCSGLPTARYSADDLARLFADGFDLEATEAHLHTTPWDAGQSFTWVVLRRRGPGPRQPAPRT